MLLYSSSSISFTLRQYDWKGKKQAEFVLCFKQHKYIYFKQVRREQRVSAAKTGKKQSAVNSPDIQTSRPGTFGWWASCPVWPCEGKCSDRAASERSAETCSQWSETCRIQQTLIRRTDPAEGAICTHRFDGLQQLDAVFLNAAVRVGKLHKGLAGCGLRFSYTDDGENIPECWEDRFKQQQQQKKMFLLNNVILPRTAVKTIAEKEAWKYRWSFRITTRLLHKFGQVLKNLGRSSHCVTCTKHHGKRKALMTWSVPHLGGSAVKFFAWQTHLCVSARAQRKLWAVALCAPSTLQANIGAKISVDAQSVERLDKNSDQEKSVSEQKVFKGVLFIHLCRALLFSPVLPTFSQVRLWRDALMTSHVCQTVKITHK